MPVTSYSTVAANNNGAPPNGWPEGQAPSSVNDCGRQLMADIAREAQVNAVKYLNTIAGTNTITADMNPELASYSAGMLVCFTPANTNTGAVTIAIDGLTALDIVKSTGIALVAGDLVVGVPAILMLDDQADDFYLLNPQRLGNVSATGITISGEPVFYGGVAVKSADTSRNTTTTNTDDPHLQIVIPATGTYRFELLLFVTCTTTTTQGFKFTLATTGTITSTINDAIFANNGTGSVSTAFGSTTPLAQAFANSNIDFYKYTGVMVLTGAQTLKVQWAQNSSSANNTTLKAGSHLTLQRLA